MDAPGEERAEGAEQTFPRGPIFRQELDPLGPDCRTSPKLARQYADYMRDIAYDTRHSWVEVNDVELTR